MRKFWNKADDAIYIYGDIVSEKWDEADTTAKSFVDDLKSFGNKPVNLHLNSGGGDVFTALAISNVIKTRGNVNVMIDGICASAATIIAVGGKHISMANNALFMIHEPATGLMGYFGAEELAKVQKSLAAVKDTILTTYKNRPLSDKVKLEEMLSAETWMTASEAKEYGFVDEVTGASDLKFDNQQKCLFVNNFSVDCRKLDNAKLGAAVKAAQVEVGEMENKTVEATASVNIKDAVQAAITEERQRVKNLTALKCDNAAVNAIVALAMEDGKTVEEIQPYVDAVKAATPVEVKTAETPAPTNNGLEQLVATIRDQLTSGAEGVTGSTPPKTEAEKAQDKKQAAVDRLLKYANEV